MEPNQIEKRVEWLDAQRRKDLDELKTLHVQIVELEKQISSQEKQIKDLSGELSRVAAQSSRIQQFDDLLTKHRKDFSRQLGDIVDRQADREHHLERIRKTEREEANKAIEELRIELEQLENIRQSLENRREDGMQLNRKLDAFDKDFDHIKSAEEDLARSLLSVEESRKMDGKRIADLQSESTELRKRIDAVRGVTDTVEDRVRRFETKLSEVSVGENSRMDAQNAWIEEQELRVVAFQKEWQKWQERFDGFQRKAENLDERLLKYDESYRSVKQTRETLDKLIERLERRIGEIHEMQRISEDRIKSEWSVFQADDQKRWNTYRLTVEEERREHDRIHEKISRELADIDERLSKSLASLEVVATESSKRVIDLLNVVQEWAEETEPRLKQIK